ncbi:hypothetical protein ACSBR2_026880 [Camellia fascicularis]
MIVCSSFAPIYYAFFCNPYSQFLYLTSISLVGILVIITLLAPALSTPPLSILQALPLSGHGLLRGDSSSTCHGSLLGPSTGASGPRI